MKPRTTQSGAHISRVEVIRRTTDSKGRAHTGQQPHIRGRWCSEAQTCSHCRGCWTLRAALLAFGQHRCRFLRGACRFLPSGQHLFVWVDGALSLRESPFLFVSKGSTAIECLFCGRQIKLLKICPRFSKNKILPLLRWEEQRQLGFCFYTGCKQQFCCAEHSARRIFHQTPFPWGSSARRQLRASLTDA